MRSFISLAALLVKVTMRIWCGEISFSRIRYATLWVRTRVFPDPAPARIRIGPSVATTAFCCASFKYVRRGVSMAAQVFYNSTYEVYNRKLEM